MSEPAGTGHEPRMGWPRVRCPFCGAKDAEPISLFGSQLLTEQWYCHACRTPFERVKDEREDSPHTSSSPMDSAVKPAES